MSKKEQAALAAAPDRRRLTPQRVVQPSPPAGRAPGNTQPQAIGRRHDAARPRESAAAKTAPAVDTRREQWSSLAKPARGEQVPMAGAVEPAAMAPGRSGLWQRTPGSTLPTSALPKQPAPATLTTAESSTNSFFDNRRPQPAVRAPTSTLAPPATTRAPAAGSTPMPAPRMPAAPVPTPTVPAVQPAPSSEISQFDFGDTLDGGLALGGVGLGGVGGFTSVVALIASQPQAPGLSHVLPPPS